MTLPWNWSRRRAARNRVAFRPRLPGALLLTVAMAIVLVTVVAPVSWTPALAMLAVQLFVLMLAAHSFPVQLLPGTTIYATTAPLFAAVLLLPLPLALALAAPAVLLAMLFRRERDAGPLAFSVGAALLQLTAAAAAAAACGWAPGHSIRGREALLPLAPLAAAAAMYLTNFLLVELTIARRRRQAPWHGIWMRWFSSALQEGTLFLLGALFVRTALHAPWLISLMAVPLVVVYRSVRDAVALRASETRFRALAQHAPDLVLIVDAQERLQYVSGAALPLLGIAPDALVRDSLLSRIHPDDRSVLQALLSGDHPGVGGELQPVIRCRHRDGSWRIVQLHCTDLRENPGIGGLVLVLRDITARRRVEQAQALLVEATGRFAASLDEGQVLQDLAELVVPGLAAWCIVDRLDEGGCLSAAVIQHPPTETATALAAAIQEQRGREIRVAAGPYLPASQRSSLHHGRTDELWPRFAHGCAAPPPTADAAPLSLLVVPLWAGERTIGMLSLLRLPGQRPFDTADRDLVESLAGRAALCVANGRLYTEVQRAVRVRDEFFASASHDLRTPVTTIAGYAELLVRRLGRETRGAGAAECIELVTGIQHGSKRLANQIDQLLDVSRVQAGEAPALRPSPTDLVALVRDVIADQQRLSPRHTLVLDPGSPTCTGSWDAACLDRIVSNLLSNAVKYSPEGGQVTVRVVEEVDAGGAWATLTVADEGVGIPLAEQPRIFERYYRASNIDPRIAGSGIGLANVAALVRQHDGQIEVESAAADGTRFRVRLPLLRSAIGAMTA